MELMEAVKFSRLLVPLLFTVLIADSVNGIGVNWGTQATHPLPASTVVKMLKDNGIQKVKLFDADATILDALKKSGIQVMVGIPNDMLYTLANSVEAAEKWVSKNVSTHVSSGGVDIRYTPFSSSLLSIDSFYSDSYIWIWMHRIEWFEGFVL
ncbi:hypothetical protein L6164_024241 [Bauhinia variegata]|uniref:Uncharacterized protein n=1 Tax=Bauhinia variegata TaxID=167791 RepID=A0ACB9LWZ1_BAUVA|nr:hypothetical protein L6164_024241 [Bauhinia variegata]